ncbi:glycosyltransferase family 4 protein [Leptothoe spongobia TAU-MAC 1115]|uniref:Glycosyltransferase family 4 protein n=1 Tax=Leptothoe spongobia TAU-MAC 1115 TaxID=1967444 RepID=A0A947DIG4_9CYAN|nr:glycosyltransferase family 4 protein [Leptothoe spongobia TAU-MAC 1115]
MKSLFIPRGSTENNPYQRQLADSLEELGVDIDYLSHQSFFLLKVFRIQKPHVLHFHWLHSFIVKSNFIKSFTSSLLFISQIFILRLFGSKIVWTVHNLKNHDNLYINLDKKVTSLFAKLSHRIIAHCDAAKKEIIREFGLHDDNKVCVIPHGNYISSYENIVGKTDSRKYLGLEDKDTVFLFLGLIRPYKGVLELIESFKLINDNRVKLLIVGKVWGDDLAFYKSVEEGCNSDPRISFIPGFVPNDRLQVYFNASDVVVFPYQNILTSGAVLLAMSFGKACIAPRLGCIAEALDDVGSFLYDVSDAHGLQKSIQLAIQEKEDLSSMGIHNLELSNQYNWPRISKITLDVYNLCIEKS